jgi:hypothetical protein
MMEQQQQVLLGLEYCQEVTVTVKYTVVRFCSSANSGWASTCVIEHEPAPFRKTFDLLTAQKIQRITQETRIQET